MISKNLDSLNLDGFPIVIFGSGPAGMSTALELEKKDINSLIVEAGGEYFSKNSQEFYKGEIIGDPLLDLSVTRLRQLGGTTGVWGGMCKPLEDFTFENWPIKSDELKSYLEKTCKILEVNNQFRRAPLNEYINQVEYQWSTVSFANKYKDHIKKSKKITLVLNTQLLHLVGDNNTTKYAECISGQVKKKIKAKYFILACGGIENSRLLLWTKVKNNGFINQKLPIGKYWMNHHHIFAGRAVLSRKKLKEKMRNNFLGYNNYMHFSTSKKLIKKKGISSATAYMLTQNVFWKDKIIDKEVLEDILCVAPKYGRKLAKMLASKDLECQNIRLLLEQEPIENNKITLDDKKDKFKIPKVRLFYKKNIHTIRTAKLFLEEFANLCRKDDLGRVAIKNNIVDLEDFDLVGDGGHHMGGTRMGTDKNKSVVDNNLKVHDINNLYIGGSSNFVTGGYTNPTFTIIQLAIRLAEEINKRLYSLTFS